MPRTRLGRYSVGLVAAFLALFMLLQLLVASGQRGGDSFSSNLVLSVPALAAATSAVFAFLAGVVSIVWNGERAVLVFLSTATGSLVVVFLFGEVLVPH